MTNGWRVFLMTVLVAAGFIAKPMAAGLDFTGGGPEGAVDITSDQGIEWMQREQKFIAKGNARAIRNNVTVHADELVAHYRDRKEGGGTEIWKLEALGHVRIISAETKVTGDSAVYDIDNVLLVIKGVPVAKLQTPTDTVTATDSLEYWEAKRVAVARGDAFVQHDDKRLRADTITADLKEDKNGKLEIKQANAFGNVLVRTANDVATGDKGIYYTESQLATLTGNVKITRDKNQLNGGYAEVNMATGVSKLFPAAPGTAGTRVQGILAPDGGRKKK
ncbi:OstA-like family protein [Rhodospirillaceae bacterium LM-1]|nr:OstA-like family protein [Rhodospirillaceae bacterium LM-1]